MLQKTIHIITRGVIRTLILSSVLSSDVDDTTGVSHIICQKCQREILTFSRALKQDQELERFREICSEVCIQKSCFYQRRDKYPKSVSDLDVFKVCMLCTAKHCTLRSRKRQLYGATKSRNIRNRVHLRKSNEAPIKVEDHHDIIEALEQSSTETHEDTREQAPRDTRVETFDQPCDPPPTVPDPAKSPSPVQVPRRSTRIRKLPKRLQDYVLT